MAGTNSNFTENKLVDTLMRNGVAYQPTGLFLALFSANPDFEAGTGGTEATLGNYVRKAVAFDAAVGGTTQNTLAVTWTVGTDIASGTYVGWAVYDDPAAGNMLFGDAFPVNRTLSTPGDSLTFGVGSITYSMT